MNNVVIFCRVQWIFWNMRTLLRNLTNGILFHLSVVQKNCLQHVLIESVPLKITISNSWKNQLEPFYSEVWNGQRVLDSGTALNIILIWIRSWFSPSNTYNTGIEAKLHASGCIDVAAALLASPGCAGGIQGCRGRQRPQRRSAEGALLRGCSAGAAQSGRDSQRVRRCPITSNFLRTIHSITGPSLSNP